MDESAKAVGAFVGPRLRRIRRWHDLSQAQLAYHAEIHRTQISLIEGGEHMPRLDTFVKLAGSLLLPASELLDGILWERRGERPGRMVVVGRDADADPPARR